MDRALLQCCTASNRAAARDDGVTTQDALIGGSRSQVVGAIAQQSEISKVRLTQTDRGLHNRIQHGLEIRWRSADDIEHIARCGLIFERFCELLCPFGEFARPSLLRLEQPRALNRYHRLVGKSFEQLYLSVRKWADFNASIDNSTDGLA